MAAVMCASGGEDGYQIGGLSYAYKLDIDLSTIANGYPKSCLVPLQGQNYAGRKLVCELHVYGNTGFTARSYHWCTFYQLQGANESWAEPNKPHARLLHERNVYSAAAKRWIYSKSALIWDRHGMHAGYYGQSNFTCYLKNSLPVFFGSQNSRYWHGSGYRIIGTIYYN